MPKETLNTKWSRESYPKILESAGNDMRTFECRCRKMYAESKLNGAQPLRCYDGWKYLKSGSLKVAAIFDAPTWREEMMGHVLAGETGQSLAVLFSFLRDSSSCSALPLMCNTLIMNALSLNNDQTLVQYANCAQYIYYFGNKAWGCHVKCKFDKAIKTVCCRHLSLHSLNQIRLQADGEGKYATVERLARLAMMICGHDVQTMESFREVFNKENY